MTINPGQPREPNGQFGHSQATENPAGMLDPAMMDEIKRYNSEHPEGKPPVPYSVPQVVDYWDSMEFTSSWRDMDKLAAKTQEGVPLMSCGQRQIAALRMPPLKLYRAASRAGRMRWQIRQLPDGSLEELRQYSVWAGPGERANVGELLDHYDCELISTAGGSALLDLPTSGSFDTPDDWLDAQLLRKVLVKDKIERDFESCRHGGSYQVEQRSKGDPTQPWDADINVRAWCAGRALDQWEAHRQASFASFHAERAAKKAARRGLFRRNPG